MLLSFDPPDACEMWLLAADGNYLAAAPRKVPSILLASGNRMDVIVRCSSKHSYDFAALVSRPTDLVPTHSSMLTGAVATVRIGSRRMEDYAVESGSHARRLLAAA